MNTTDQWKPEPGRTRRRRLMLAKMWAYNPRCNVCDCLTIMEVAQDGVPQSPNRAVLVHAATRLDPERKLGQYRNVPRSYLACKKCADETNKTRIASMPKEELRKLAGHQP